MEMEIVTKMLTKCTIENDYFIYTTLITVIEYLEYGFSMSFLAFFANTCVAILI